MNQHTERAARQVSPGAIMIDFGRLDRRIIDIMLGHVEHATVEGRYNRAAYIDRRFEIACEWASILLEGFPPASSLLRRP